MKTIFKFKYLLFVSVGLLILFSSCDPNRVFDENETLPENVWDRKNKLPFNVTITDTVSLYNVFINVRNADGYPYGNLFLFIHSTFPNGQKFTDTLECVLADANGKWLGDGIGDIYDNQIPFKHNVRFRLAGNYTFELEQAMRLEMLPLIMDAGIRIEKAKQ
ncbi:MAG: gliding motility lipoprotein GldH [Bacteroidia bacterium]|nr:gliding motility lipoprotein GldH [Bacteroidia bacterium]